MAERWYYSWVTPDPTHTAPWFTPSQDAEHRAWGRRVRALSEKQAPSEKEIAEARKEQRMWAKWWLSLPAHVRVIYDATGEKAFRIPFKWGAASIAEDAETARPKAATRGWRVCGGCGQRFRGRRDARHCGDTCRQRAYRAKQGGKRGG